MYGENIYYSPEKFSLELVGVVSDPNASYSFDDFAVWTDGRRIYCASDAGCSCPSPFEEYTSVEQLKGGTKDSVLKLLDEWNKGDYSGERGYPTVELRRAIDKWRPGKKIVV